jgi:hypothetical protein
MRVSDVSQVDVAYSSDIQVMEEAGTPGILQDIRCGLAFKIKDELVGARRIEVKPDTQTPLRTCSLA